MIKWNIFLLFLWFVYIYFVLIFLLLNQTLLYYIYLYSEFISSEIGFIFCCWINSYHIMSGGYPFHTQSPRNNFYQERHKQYSPGENGDFIPLRFSSPIHHPRGAGPSNSGRPFHRRSHGGFSSGFNSTGSPYNNNSFTRNTRSFNNRSGGRRVIICWLYNINKHYCK